MKTLINILYEQINQVKNGGAGGIRTLVQTTETSAFYKLSFHLIFDDDLAENYTINT